MATRYGFYVKFFLFCPMVLGTRPYFKGKAVNAVVSYYPDENPFIWLVGGYIGVIYSILYALRILYKLRR